MTDEALDAASLGRTWAPPPPPGFPHREGIAEAAELWWRRETNLDSLRRRELIWTLWTATIVVTFLAPAAVLLWLQPLTAPVAAICLAHGWLIPQLSARRGWRQVVPIGSARSARRTGSASSEAERVSLGLLGDLLSHDQRSLALSTGLAMQRGELGVWLLGEQGALLVRQGGRRVDCWCVRVAAAGALPGGDRVAHLLLALREDERGFATVANLGFSGATRRIRSRMPAGARAALDVARSASKS
jgi:hypothetical protein